MKALSTFIKGKSGNLKRTWNTRSLFSQENISYFHETGIGYIIDRQQNNKQKRELGE